VFILTTGTYTKCNQILVRMLEPVYTDTNLNSLWPDINWSE